MDVGIYYFYHGFGLAFEGHHIRMENLQPGWSLLSMWEVLTNFNLISFADINRPYR